MYSHPQFKIDQDEVLKLRQAAGRWLRSLRDEARLSQRELANAVGIEYYTFISQIESGRGRIPPAQISLWATALNVPTRQFAIKLMRYYDPMNYGLIFANGNETTRAREALEARIAKLESMFPE